MKHFIYVLSIFFTLLMLSSGCNSSYDSVTADLSSQTDSLSYSFGFLQGSSLSAEGIEDVDIKNYVAGLIKGLDGEEAEIDQMAMQMLIQTYFQELQERQMADRAAQADVNIAQGRAFLEENLNNDDVFETESGLQYRILEEGDGPRPAATDEVEVHYRGTLITDEVFDSSYDRGEPVTFPLNRVIPGWTEGVQLMNVGSRFQFYIPADLAYGNNPPQGSIIPPGAVLIFEVELLDIK
ncbi:MAG: FKBP-type peptidyl-prolyl cis-trans isomerase [Balneolaceae bacterium]|nr:MAG: FKBP-type peptidyl-prolyl cis-trans isomerase [Balneolaceae bacterium]